jgi:putative ABC transport system substrate-binding protein
MQFDQLKRREFIMLLGVANAWPLAAWAQQGERVRRIALLLGFPEGDVEGEASVAAFQEGLQELGWTKGRNIRIDIRWTGGCTARQPGRLHAGTD